MFTIEHMGNGDFLLKVGQSAVDFPKAHTYQRKDKAGNPLTNADGTPKTTTYFTFAEMPYKGNMAEGDMEDGTKVYLNKNGLCFGADTAVRAEGAISRAEAVKRIKQAVS